MIRITSSWIKALLCLVKEKTASQKYLKARADKVLTVRDQRGNCQERCLLGFGGHWAGNLISLSGHFFEATLAQRIDSSK
jgi:hypothetical protein